MANGIQFEFKFICHTHGNKEDPQVQIWIKKQRRKTRLTKLPYIGCTTACSYMCIVGAKVAEQMQFHKPHTGADPWLQGNGQLSQTYDSLIPRPLPVSHAAIENNWSCLENEAAIGIVQLVHKTTYQYSHQPLRFLFSKSLSCW